MPPRMRTPSPAAHQAVVGRAARDGEVEVGAGELAAGGPPARATLFRMLEHAAAGRARAFITPPLNRTAVGERRLAAPLGLAGCRPGTRPGGAVIAGSCAYGRPSSWRPSRRRALRPGVAARRRGKKPSTSTLLHLVARQLGRDRAADERGCRGPRIDDRRVSRRRGRRAAAPWPRGRRGASDADLPGVELRALACASLRAPAA